jgi:signal peptidase II
MNMPNMTRKVHYISMLLGLLAIIFDQVTKMSVLAFVPLGDVIKVCPSFNLVLVFNSGTSFGLMTPSNIVGHYFIIVLTILCLIFLIYIFFKFRTITEKVLCSLLIGGAISNLIDRLWHGAVVDFLDIYYGTWHWPVFNFADAFISCSAVCLLLYNLFSKKV